MVLEELHPRLTCSLSILIHTYAHTDICKCSYMHTQKEFCLLIQEISRQRTLRIFGAQLYYHGHLNFLSYWSYDYSKLGFRSRRLQHLNYIKRQRKSKFWGLFFPLAHLFLEGWKSFPKFLPGNFTSNSLRDLWRSSHCRLGLWRVKKNVHGNFSKLRSRHVSKGLGLYPKMMENGGGKVLRISHGKVRKRGRAFRQGKWDWAAAVLFGLWSQRTHLLYTSAIPVRLTNPLSLLTACSQVLKALICLACIKFFHFVLFWTEYH